jgi:hypothetical protein
MMGGVLLDYSGALKEVYKKTLHGGKIFPTSSYLNTKTQNICLGVLLERYIFNLQHTAQTHQVRIKHASLLLS